MAYTPRECHTGFLRTLPYQREAPSRMDMSGLETISPGSTCNLTPSPLHSAHMPMGELKLNREGCSSGKLISQLGQAVCSLRVSSLSPSSTMVRSPPPALAGG